MLKLSKWPGSRITGQEGTKFICHFSSEVDSNELTKSNKLLNLSNTKFEPWMSHIIYPENFSELNGDSSLDLDIIDLNKRAQVFSNSENLNLWNIDPDLNPNVTLMGKSDMNFALFKESLKSVFDIFNKIDSSWHLRKTNLICEILPMVSHSNDYSMREDGAGTSCLLYRKGIFLSLPKNSSNLIFELSLNLVHELGHQALMLYEHLDDIVVGSSKQKVFSVIRRTERPAIQSCHALVATAYMLEFMVNAKDDLVLLTNKEYFLNRRDQLYSSLIEGIEILKKIPMTNLGKQIFDELVAFSIWLSESHKHEF